MCHKRPFTYQEQMLAPWSARGSPVWKKQIVPVVAELCGGISKLNNSSTAATARRCRIRHDQISCFGAWGFGCQNDVAPGTDRRGGWATLLLRNHRCIWHANCWGICEKLFRKSINSTSSTDDDVNATDGNLRYYGHNSIWSGRFSLSRLRTIQTRLAICRQRRRIR